MDEQSAKDIIRCSIRTMALFNQLISDLQQKLPDEEFKYQRRVIGAIMGNIEIDLINPATAVFPSLNVNDAEQWHAAGALDEPTWLRHTGR